MPKKRPFEGEHDQAPPPKKKRPGGRACVFGKCETYANFGYPGERPTYCSAHKLAKMVNVAHKRCAAEECMTLPSFGLPGHPPSYCAVHKLAKMVNVTAKRCAAEDCMTVPNFGHPGSRPHTVPCTSWPRW